MVNLVCANNSKRAIFCMDRVINNIGTHDGKFHCDEALACYLLKVLPDCANAAIIRTRKELIMDTCDIVVDVGGVYDPVKLRFDHHQKTFNSTLSSLFQHMPFDTKLSSAGLIYGHFGKQIIKTILHFNQELDNNSKKLKLDEELIQFIYFKVYENFIQEIDAIDNGIEICECKQPKKYKISTNISARVGHLNPSWNENHKNPEDQFVKAMALVGSEFVDRVNFYAFTLWPAREIVISSINKRFQICDSGEIVLLDQYAPWQDIVYEIEKEQNLNPLIKYIILPTDSPNDWRVQCVSVGPGSFQNRLSLPLEWRGLRDEELSTVSGIPDCVFVHMTGFIGGNKAKEGAIAMAKKSLQMEAKKNGENHHS